MHTSLVAIILVSIVIPAGDTPATDSNNYRISEVVGVMSPDSFQCKLDDYKPAPFVRFRVRLPDAETLTTEALSERLNSAKEIELRNIEFRNYFRIEGDLWIDGQLFLEKRDPETTRKGIGTQKQPGNIPGHQFGTTPPWQSPNLSVERPAKRSIKNPYEAVTIRDLLDTSVDCSMLSDDTPLSEALTILSESVEPRLPLLILWNDLQVNALVEKDMPIGVAGFSYMKLRQALNIIMRLISGRGPRLALVAEGKILTLGTEQLLFRDKITQVYAIEDLLSPPSTGSMYNQGGFGNRGGFNSQGNLGNLIGNVSR